VIEIPIRFINEPTKAFFEDTNRNQCLSGGFNSGKTFISCLKAITLLTNFNSYRMVIGRQEYKTLLNTTFKTFTKICPQELIKRWDEQKGYMKLSNGSEVLWMHLDEIDEHTIRGLEVNSVYIDQPEDVSENVYILLDGRLARWDRARPNNKLLAQRPDWPKDAFGNYLVPSYMMLTPNPDDVTHWIWRYYHPDSPEQAKNHSYYEVTTLQNPHADPETLRVMMSRDPSWVKRFIFGQWGISDATIHTILPESIIDPPIEFLRTAINYGNCVRALDHGDASPTSCVWSVAYKNWYFFYREYYQPHRTISHHRNMITEMSKDEFYVASVADPQCFKETSQKYGGFWTTAREYYDTALDAPPLHWQPADNNEMATRNRINEMLALDPIVEHPITHEKPAPRYYFIQKNEGSQYGLNQLLNEIRAQKREKIGEINGRTIFSDDRAKGVPDHAYDCFRYITAYHNSSPREIKRKFSDNSFLGARNRVKSLNEYQRTLNLYGDPKAMV